MDKAGTDKTPFFKPYSIVFYINLELTLQVLSEVFRLYNKPYNLRPFQPLL